MIIQIIYSSTNNLSFRLFTILIIILLIKLCYVYAFIQALILKKYLIQYIGDRLYYIVNLITALIMHMCFNIIE